MNRNWIAPACGVALVVVAVIGVFVFGQGQDPAKKTAQEVLNHYSDHHTKEVISSVLFALLGLLVLIYAGWIRQVLRQAEGAGGMLSAVAFGGLVVVAAGTGVGASIHLALADYADDIGPAGASAINAIDYDFFFPMIVGILAFQIATAISILRNGAFPRWLGWVAAVGSVISFAGPAGFVGFLIGLLVILISSIIGISRSGSEAPATA